MRYRGTRQRTLGSGSTVAGASGDRVRGVATDRRPLGGGHGLRRCPVSAISRRLQTLMEEVAIEQFEGQVVVEPIEGYQILTRRRLVDPLPAVRAAAVLRDAARRVLVDVIEAARAAGRSWGEIGTALGMPDDGDPVGEVAFALIVEGREPQRTRELFRVPSTSWRCTACGELVQDRGPFESHPGDNESGHTDTCARHRADVQAWRARTGWEDE